MCRNNVSAHYIYSIYTFTKVKNTCNVQTCGNIKWDLNLSYNNSDYLIFSSRCSNNW